MPSHLTNTLTAEYSAVEQLRAANSRAMMGEIACLLDASTITPVMLTPHNREERSMRQVVRPVDYITLIMRGTDKRIGKEERRTVTVGS